MTVGPVQSTLGGERRADDLLEKLQLWSKWQEPWRGVGGSRKVERKCVGELWKGLTTGHSLLPALQFALSAACGFSETSLKKT